MILSLLFLTPVFNYIPDASLAAVIISAVYDLVDFTLLAKLWRVNSTYIGHMSFSILCNGYGVGLAIERSFHR